MTEEKDNGYWQGKTDATVESIAQSLDGLHVKVDVITADHNTRLVKIETSGKIFKWIASLGGGSGIVAMLSKFIGGQ